MDPTVEWKCSDLGDKDDRPLVLLHGIGMSRAVWEQVLDRLLTAKRRVIAFDLPGHGETKALPRRFPDDAPTPKRMAEELRKVLDAMGITKPVDIAGNSLGGYVALEFAKLRDTRSVGYARSVVGISPAGLWRGSAPRWVDRVLRLVRWWTVPHSRRLRLAKWFMHFRVCRTRLLKIIAARGCRISANEAIRILDDFAKANPNLESVGRAAEKQFKDGKDIDKSIPCTIVFGDEDRLLRRKDSQYPDELPSHYCGERLLDCGHVPMWDDPEAVSNLILNGTA